MSPLNPLRPGDLRVNFSTSQSQQPLHPRGHSSYGAPSHHSEGFVSPLVLALPIVLGIIFALVRHLAKSPMSGKISLHLGALPPCPIQLSMPCAPKREIPHELSTPDSSKEKPLQIGDYRILGELGRGGMGTVFKAIDPRGQIVAIKMIGGLGLDRRKAKFNKLNRIGLVREASLAVKLHHPNIVRIYDLGEHNGNLYVVMEYLAGTPLTNICNRKPPILEALRIMAELCDALSYAHSHGIVHRDVKPANIFITDDGRVKVLDFGLASRIDMFMGRLAPAGTPPYMSPEQILGGNVDSRSDIWSAGITFFELLTQERPFQGGTIAELVNNIVTAGVPKLSTELHFAYNLEIILERALAKRRELRYATADDFAADLRLIICSMQEPSSEGQIVRVDRHEIISQTPSPPSDLAQESMMGLNLGFVSQFGAQVFNITPSGRPPQSWFAEKLSGVRSTLELLLDLPRQSMTRSGNVVVDLSAVVISLSALMVMGILGATEVLIRSLQKLATHPAPLCRSCERRMRLASVWLRSPLQDGQAKFCVTDCLAALEEGLFEEAVKLLCLYTTIDNAKLRYKIEFFECGASRDQRVHFGLEYRLFPIWETGWMLEFYRFRSPEEAPGVSGAKERHENVSHPGPTRAEATVHDKTTLSCDLRLPPPTPPSSAAGDSMRFDEAYQHGRDLIMPYVFEVEGREQQSSELQNEDLRDGICCLDIALGLHPKNWPAWYLRGLAEQALGDHQTAYHSFRSSYDISPQNVDSAQELVLEALWIGKTAEGVHLAEQVVRDQQANAGPLVYLALAYLMDGRIHEAVRTALQLELSNGFAMFVKQTVDDVEIGKRSLPSRVSEILYRKVGTRFYVRSPKPSSGHK